MNPLNPIFAVFVYLIAFITAYGLKLKYNINNDNTRYETIDGLRGFLAMGVFIHHASIWFQYLQTDSWETPKSNLYNQLGQTSVSFFFMITSFLFITKLLNTGNRKMNWNVLFISRFFRLVPMYLTSTFVLIIIVFATSNWKLNVSVVRFVEEMVCWGTFTILGAPNINGSLLTPIINAGVVWSLPYEWLFYFSLPTISIFIFKKRVSILYVFVSLLFILFFYTFRSFNEHHLLSFAGGAIAPFIIKYRSLKIDINSKIFSATLLLSLVLMLFFKTPNDYFCKLLIIIVFNIIALGNNLGGILKSSVLKFLGEISYSTYLVHGMLIYIVMYCYSQIEEPQKISPTEYCSIIFSITPVVVFISFILYRYIEKPFMNYSKKLTSKIKTINSN